LIHTYVSPPGEAAPEQVPDPTIAAAFYAVLGEAITSWQCVEASLFDIFAALVNATAPRSPLSASFYQVPSFRGRLDMTNAAAVLALGDSKLRAEWNALYGMAIDRSKRRNALAHSVVFHEPAVRNPVRRLYLHPPLSDHLRATVPKRQSDKITVKEIGEMRTGFVALYRSLHDFHFKLWFRETPPAASP